jgi:predicted transcriptional regulator
MPRMATRRKPTDAELRILGVLWDKGPSTVRRVADELDGAQSYTTVLKLLQIMHDKGLVARDESARTHIYRAARPADGTRRQLVADLIARAFDGSAAKLVLHALDAGTTSPEELAEIRRLIDRHREGRK